MSPRSRPKATGLLMSSAADSPAKTSALPEKAPACPAQGLVFGTSSLGSFAKYDPSGSLWRTCERSLLGESTPYSGKWPTSGMTRNGIAYRLAPLVPRTAGNASGLWRMPSATAAAMWPTPKASAAGPDFAKTARSKTGISLATAAAMWPTPAATDGKGAGKTGQLRDRLDYAAERGQTKTSAYPPPPPTGGSLNPTWVEWLMGFPPGWTALDASETPLSRRSLRSSAARSSTRKVP